MPFQRPRKLNPSNDTSRRLRPRSDILTLALNVARIVRETLPAVPNMTYERLAKHRVTVLGDDLYCNQPFCEQVLRQKLNFIFTCKPDSHPALYTEVALLARIAAVEQVIQRHWTGSGHEVWT